MLKARSPQLRYAAALLIMGLAVGGTFVLLHTVGPNPAITFLYVFAMMAVAWWGGFGPGILVCLLYFFVVPFLFIPHFTVFRIDPTRVSLTFLVSLLISWIASTRRHTETELLKAKADLERRIAERTQTLADEVNEHKQTEERLRTQYAVSHILTAASTFADAGRLILQTIAVNLGWSVGVLWMLDDQGQELRCAEFWQQKATSGQFENVNRTTRFHRGVGLPGRICASAQPTWIVDLHEDTNFTRLNAAAAEGLASGFGFPILHQDRVLGVLEFFSPEVRPADSTLLQGVTAVGQQIGQFLERERALEALQERETRYRVVTETASDGIVTIDEGSLISFANQAAARLFGYTCEELIGKDLTLLLPEYLRAVHKGSLQRYLETGERHIAWHAVALPGLHKSGRELALEVSFGEHQQDSRRIFTGIIRDVSDRKRTEAQLQHTQKLESLGLLAGGVAHDFNNLLTGILGNASLAFDTAGPGNPVRPVLREIIEASEQAAHLTRQLLAYAGKGRFIVEPINISTLVAETSNLIRTSIPKSAYLRLDLRQPLPFVAADASQIQQVVMNLVINGAEAVSEGQPGTVFVTTGVQEVDEAYIRTTFSPGELSPGDYVSLEVHDTGVGMDEQTLNKIFDPFFTTKFTGRGLGLSAVMGIVRSHGGALKVYSTPGQGSTFKVLLPAASSPEPIEERERAAMAPLPQAGGGLALVVDDEEIVRRMAKTILEQAGYTVALADTGEQALDIFRPRAPEVLFVLLDLTMPGMSGEAAFRQLKTIRPDIKVILSSGYNEVETIQRFTGKGLAGFIQKPYTAAKLMETIQKILTSR